MYVESQDGNAVGIINKQQAEATAAVIERDREKGRRFLREMGEDDSEGAVDALIEEYRKTP
jgi:hypothetical protein